MSDLRIKHFPTPEDATPFVFTPLPNITAPELAAIFGALALRVTPEVVQKLPKECRRHFTNIEARERMN